MNVALVYDRVNKWGGAERVLLALHKLFPKSHLYTSVYDRKNALWAKEFTVHTSFLQKVPFARSHHEWFFPLMPVVFESFSFDNYDLVISVTSADAKGIITKPHTKHICYCLTPTRYLWSHYDIYIRQKIVRKLSRPLVSYLRKWDKVAANRPDYIIAVSRHVQRRIKKYYKRDSLVLYPPVSDTFYRRKHRNKNCTRKYGDYFLIVSRLVPYKKIECAIYACNKLKKTLVIVGKGVSYNKLTSIAGPTIFFVPFLSDEDLFEYYRNAQALIMVQEEDFGLVALESQLSGTPVITYKKSGAYETIIEGRTGIGLDTQSVDELALVLSSFNKRRFNKKILVQNARRFNTRRFLAQFKEQINTVFKNKL